MTKRTCIALNGLAWPISLVQTGKDSFTVTYGMHVVKRLNYGLAAIELGACIMHALACDGKLDNGVR